MAFQSVRNFKTVRKSRLRSTSPISLQVFKSITLKNGDAGYAISIRIERDFMEQMDWGEKTRIDVLVDNDEQLCKLEANPTGYAISFPSKASGYIKFKVPESFEYIPKELAERIDLKIVDVGENSVIFEMPKIQPSSLSLV